MTRELHWRRELIIRMSCLLMSVHIGVEQLKVARCRGFYSNVRFREFVLLRPQ